MREEVRDTYTEVKLKPFDCVVIDTDDGNAGTTLGVAEKLLVRVGRTTETMEVVLKLLVATLSSLHEVRCMMMGLVRDYAGPAFPAFPAFHACPASCVLMISLTSPHTTHNASSTYIGGFLSYISQRYQFNHSSPYLPPPTSHLSPLTSHLSPLTSHSSPFTLPPRPSSHSSLLTPHSSLLTPHSSLLTPHSSLLTPHFSLTLLTHHQRL